MKKITAILLAIILSFSIPLVAFATASETQELRQMEQLLKRRSYAVIYDADGNVEKTLDVKVNVQKKGVARSTEGVQYIVTYSANENDSFTGNGSRDGVTAYVTIISKDVVGLSNILISVGGSWSGDGVRTAEEATKNRKVSYTGLSYGGSVLNSGYHDDVPTSFYYTPNDFTGFTFTASTSATIVSSGKTLQLYVTTDS